MDMLSSRFGNEVRTKTVPWLLARLLAATNVPAVCALSDTMFRMRTSCPRVGQRSQNLEPKAFRPFILVESTTDEAAPHEFGSMKRSHGLFSAAKRQSLTTEIAFTTLRVFTGLALALAHGIGKLPPSPGFIEGVSKMGFPAPEVFAWLAGCSEFGGGLLLAMGLMTRPAALFILPTMFTAAFIRNAGESFGHKEKAILFGVVVLTYLIIGAGRFSVDALLRRRRIRYSR